MTAAIYACKSTEQHVADCYRPRDERDAAAQRVVRTNVSFAVDDFQTDPAGTIIGGRRTLPPTTRTTGEPLRSQAKPTPPTPGYGRHESLVLHLVGR